MSVNQLPFEHISIEDVAAALEGNELMSLVDVCGFFLCQKGSAVVSLNDQTFHIQAGDIYVYTPSTFISVLNRSSDLEGIAVKCQMDFVLPMMERIVNVRDFLTLRDNPCISLSPEQQSDLEKMLKGLRKRQMLLEKLTPDSGTFFIMQNLVLALAEAVFHELLFDYASTQHIEPQSQDPKDRIFQNFLISLFKNYKCERDVTFYANEQYLSPRYFSSIIKEKSGHSALQWIIQMVISSIRQTLKNSYRSIKEISSEFNFPTQSFFGKYFKQYTGLSPKEYRATVGNNA